MSDIELIKNELTELKVLKMDIMNKINSIDLEKASVSELIYVNTLHSDINEIYDKMFDLELELYFLQQDIEDIIPD